jgi:hypothetical protein
MFVTLDPKGELSEKGTPYRSKEEAPSLGIVYTGEKTVAGNVGFEKNGAVLLKITC